MVTTVGRPSGTARHGETDCRHEQFEEWHATQQAEHKQQRDDAERGPHQDAAKRSEFLLKRCVFIGPGFFEQAGDVSHLGLHRGGDDHGPPAASDHAGSHEDHVLAAAERHIFLAERDGVFFNGFRFAGQGALHAFEGRGSQQSRVGGDEIACLQFQHRFVVPRFSGWRGGDGG